MTTVSHVSEKIDSGLVWTGEGESGVTKGEWGDWRLGLMERRKDRIMC